MQAMVPTGDALFDAYAARVALRLERTARKYDDYVERLIEHFQLEHLRGDPSALGAVLQEAVEFGADVRRFYEGDFSTEVQQAHLLPADIARGLAGEFGHDPRYWQLLYWLAYWRRDYSAFEENSLRLRPGQFAPLLEAQQRGCADGLTLLLLRELFRAAHADYPEQQLETKHRMEAERDPETRIAHMRSTIELLRGSPSTTPRQLEQLEEMLRQMESEPPVDWKDPHWDQLTLEVFTADQAAARELVESLGLDEAGLHAAAAAASPQWAQVHYEQAGFLARQGEPAAAVAALAAGNAASVNRQLKVFPHSFALEAAQAGRIPGSLALAFELQIYTAEVPLLSTVFSLRELIKAQPDLRAKLAAATELARFMGRSALAEASAFLDMHTGFLSLQRVLTAVRDQLRAANAPAGALRLEAHIAALEQLQQHYLQLSQQRQELLFAKAEHSARNFPLSWAELQADQEPLFRREFEALAADRAFQETQVRPVVEPILALDLTTLL
jgi:hypothetical protein